jgi:hypothetical protein
LFTDDYQWRRSWRRTSSKPARVLIRDQGKNSEGDGSVQILSHMWNGPPGKGFFQTVHHPGTVRSYVRFPEAASLRISSPASNQRRHAATACSLTPASLPLDLIALQPAVFRAPAVTLLPSHLSSKPLLRPADPTRSARQPAAAS